MRAHDRRSKIACGPGKALTAALPSTPLASPGTSSLPPQPSPLHSSPRLNAAQHWPAPSALGLLFSPLLSQPSLPTNFLPFSLLLHARLSFSIPPSRSLAWSPTQDPKTAALQQLNVHVRPRTTQTHRYAASLKLALHAPVQRTHARNALRLFLYSRENTLAPSSDSLKQTIHLIISRTAHRIPLPFGYVAPRGT